jgi:hypothetical protein
MLTTTLGSAMLLAPYGAQALPLAPLGKIERIGGAKLTNLNTEEIKVGHTTRSSTAYYAVCGGPVALHYHSGTDPDEGGYI